MFFHRINCIFLLIAWVLDVIFGDPQGLYHPICAIGKLISFLEKKLRPFFSKTNAGELFGGGLEVVLVCAVSYFLPFGLIWLCGRLFLPLAWLLQIFWCYQLLAGNSLIKESKKVYTAIKTGTIEDARYAVSMIVGRDTQALTEEGVIKAAVETVAENTSDGVIAPMLFMLIGGVPMMFFYKAINTMDSMLGYKNEKYLFYGRCAAKLDDAANFFPARISALFMVAASVIMKWFDPEISPARAWNIFLRDRKKHASPNSAQTESVMAGALQVQLAGDAVYFGKLYKKKKIGDDLRPIEPEDILRSEKILFITSALAVVVLCVAGWRIF